MHEHSKPRVARFLVAIFKDEEPPIMSRDVVPPTARLIVDGVKPVTVAEFVKVARELRDVADSRTMADSEGAELWVWIGHDQFFYHSGWQWFQCFGPDGWTSKRLKAAETSFAVAADRVKRRHEDEKEANRLAALKRKETGQKKGPAVDAIALGGSQK